MRRKRNAGFTFLELMIAVAILGISVMTVMRVFSLSLKTVTASSNLTEAVLYVDTTLQEQEFNSLKGIPLRGTGGAGVECNCTVSTTIEGIQRIICVAPVRGRENNVTLVTYLR